MVTVTRLDGSAIVLNADLIESLESVPDTVVTLTTHKKVVVREPVPVIIERVIAYQRSVRCQQPREVGAFVRGGDDAGSGFTPVQGR